MEGRLGATLHTAIPLLLATPRILDTSDRKLLNCKDKPKTPDSEKNTEIRNKGESGTEGFTQQVDAQL